MKSKKKEEQKINYQFYTPPTTEAQQKYDTLVDSSYDTADPSIGYSFGRAHEAVANRFDNPFGADYSPEVRDAIKYNEHSQLDQMQGQAMREDSAYRKSAKLAAQGQSAANHAPLFASSGGTVTSTSSPGLGGIIGAGINAGTSLGSAALT